MKKNDEQKVNKLKKEKGKIGNPILSQHCDAAGWGFFNPGDRCAGSWYYLLQ